MYGMINYLVKKWGIKEGINQTITKNAENQRIKNECSCYSLFQNFVSSPDMRWSWKFSLTVLHCYVFSTYLEVWLVAFSWIWPSVGSAPRLPPLCSLSLWTLNKHPALPALHFHLCSPSLFTLSHITRLHFSLAHTVHPPFFFKPMPPFSVKTDTRRKMRDLRFPCLLIHSTTSTSKDTKRTEQNRRKWWEGVIATAHLGTNHRKLMTYIMKSINKLIIHFKLKSQKWL